MLFKLPIPCSFFILVLHTRDEDGPYTVYTNYYNQNKYLQTTSDNCALASDHNRSQATYVHYRNDSESLLPSSGIVKAR